MQKTPEDEAFDDLARRQGAWGGGFSAKRQSAIDKIKADFDEDYIKYRVAFPKEYTAASVLGDQVKYGTSWSKDGERIDPMSVYKEPEYAARAFWEKDGRIGVAVTIVRPDGGVHVLQKTIDPPQPAQEPTSGDYALGYAEGFNDACKKPAQDPVAWTTMPESEDWCFVSGNKDPNGKLDGKWFPLYTTSPQRKPLTDADYVNACISYRHDFGLMTQEQRDKLIFQAREWARAFGMNEAAHGIKE